MLHIKKITIPIKKPMRYYWQYMSGTYDIDDENNTADSPCILDKTNESKSTEMQIDKIIESQIDKINELQIDKMQIDKNNEMQIDKNNEMQIDKTIELQIDKMQIDKINKFKQAEMHIDKPNNVNIKRYLHKKTKKYINKKDAIVDMLKNNIMNKNRILYEHDLEFNSYVGSNKYIYKKVSGKNNFIKYIYSLYILQIKRDRRLLKTKIRNRFNMII